MTSCFEALALAVPTRLHPIDLVIIAIYLVGITLFGLSFRKKTTGSRSLKSYFLADRSIPWWAIALSIVSAETSTLTIISIPGLAFGGDFGFLQVVFGYMVGRIVVAAIFLPKYFQGEMLTAYQLIDKRFGPTLHKVTALLFLLTRAAAEGVRVFAVSIVVGIAIGTRDVLSIAIISALTLLYTFEGGMAAVIWTDVVQMIIYVGGTLVAMATLGTHVPGGWSHIHEVAAAAGKFHLFHFALNLTETYTFWAGLIGGTFLTMASHGTDQLMVQRMLAARNLRQSIVALLSSGVVILLQFTLFLFIGAGLFVFYGLHPAVFASADRIFPTFIVREMPIGVAGLLVAAILAAAMSNLSAALNSLSSTTVVDFYMHWRPQADDRERMLISRSSTVIWAFVLFAIAVYSVHAGGKGHVVEIGLSIASVAYGALLGVFLLGTLTRYATQTGAILGMIVGFALNILLWLHPNPIALGPITIPHVAWTWYVFIGAVATFGIGTVASFIFRTKPKTKIIATTALLAFFALSAVAARGQSSEPPDFTPISTLMNDAVAQKKLPGAIVLIGHDNKVAFEQAYGHRSLEPSVEPMTEDTIFDMASLSKCLSTAVAVMQLYEEHKLNFDDPVAKYLPAFAANGKENITIRELLTHYSGLPPDINLKDIPWGLAAPDKAEGIRRALNSPLVTTPGTHFEYSDINFITLGALVEKLSGEPLDVYAQRHIFTPLHMTHTRYLPFAEACGPHETLGAAIALSDPPHLLKSDESSSAVFKDYSCSPPHWITSAIIPHTAPTTYDDEGTAATNPDFGHMLRGTVNDPTTRRMGGVAGHAGVFSTASDVALFAQALLDRLAGRPSTFPLKQSTLELMTKPEQPSSAETTATIFTPDGKTTKGIATRGFGWDINSPFSRPRGGVFPIGSFGHTGFTGTSLWMDPASDTYVIILTNAIHPRGNPPVSVLRGEIATAAGEALHLNEDASATTAESNAPTLTGIDVLESTQYSALAEAARRHNNHLRLGLLTNQNGLDSKGNRTVDLLATDAPRFVPGLTLTTLFSPEHGIFGKQDTTKIAAETDPDTHLPVISLYGPKDSDKRPKPEDLTKLDAVVIDLQDAGVRFYTYESVVGYFLEAAAQAHIEVIVLDRPNPIGGEQVQGPVSDAGLESYTDYMPLPVRHGLTLGELARYINGERHLPTAASPDVQVPINAHLTVVPMQNWTRSEYFDQTHLPWMNPSPNLRSLTAATLYPGVALLEAPNFSVGRGTPTPFEHFGAPYIDAPQLAAYLTARKIPGVTFTPTSFPVADTADHYPYHGQTIPGIHITLTDRNALDAPELGIELLAALHRFYPKKFDLDKAERLVASVNTMLDLSNNEDPRAIAASWASDIAAFKKRSAPYLLYH
ncbi:MULTISPECIES: sodium/solute symporter [Acidobacteriaceae]|uniref:sodium:solute symporter family transporter n=1 Tax=Acidobacteriaceae TaxID=204434 RepID=UPI0020B11BC0|nr:MULTISPECIES: sodium/solute symporter [Acidobacteriaceae]MDW5266877.1 sodium/solute symporter [Edaphobacter sp.]